MSRGRGYDHYRSDNYLPEADSYSKNGVSLDAGTSLPHGLRSNAGAAARNRLDALESDRKNLALIKGNGQHGSYGAGPGSRGSYDRSLENRNYLKQNLTPAQLREAAQNSLSTRAGPAAHMNSLPPSGIHAAQRLISNQYQPSQHSASMGLPHGASGAGYRNQYQGAGYSYQNQLPAAAKGHSGPIISTHNRHGLIEVSNRRGNYPTASGQNSQNWW